jgi:hypothetical protein
MENTTSNYSNINSADNIKSNGINNDYIPCRTGKHQNTKLFKRLSERTDNNVQKDFIV